MKEYLSSTQSKCGCGAGSVVLASLREIADAGEDQRGLSWCRWSVGLLLHQSSFANEINRLNKKADILFHNELLR